MNSSDHHKATPDFKQIYLTYYPRLVRFATEFILKQEDAENIVQDVFVMLWEQKNTIQYIDNIQAYLYKVVKRKCIDHLRHRLMVESKKEIIQNNRMKEYAYNLLSINAMENNLFDDPNIDTIIHQAIDTLPEKCREIFILSRFDNLSHKAIAEKLNISPSTVNNQIAEAMKKLKDRLKYLLSILLLIFL